MITITEFSRRVKHNRNVLAAARTNNKNISWVLDKIYTIDTSPGEVSSTYEIMRKIDDIYPALTMDHLPTILTKNGADGYRLNGDTINEVEYKTCLFDINKFGVGPRGGLHYRHRGESRVTGITSTISAVYEIHTEKCVYTKARDTYFILSERNCNDWSLVDILLLDKAKIIPLLQRTKARQRRISLAVFLNEGEQMEPNEYFDIERWGYFKRRVIKMHE